MTIGDLVVSKRTGHVGIVLDATTDDARDHDLVKLFIEGSKTVGVGAPAPIIAGSLD